MKRNKYLLLLVVFFSLIVSCSLKQISIKNTVWKFTYDEGDYAIFSFSDDYFSIADYRILEKEMTYIEVTGIYTIKNDKITLTGENGKIYTNGEFISQPFMKELYNGEYSYSIKDERLVLDKDNATLTLKRFR